MDTRRKNALRYALNNRCPRCGQAPIIPSLFRIHNKCAHCHFEYDRGDGFFTGALPINYSLVCVLWIVPLMALWFCDLIPNWACLVLCGLGALIGPILLYRYSQCIWLALYYSLVVDELQSAPESTTPTAHPVSSNAAASAENGADTAPQSSSHPPSKPAADESEGQHPPSPE